MLPGEAYNELANERGRTLTQLVEKENVEVAQKIVDFTKQLQQSAAEEVGKTLKAQIEVKR